LGARIDIWVLCNGHPAALVNILALPNVRVEDEAEIMNALALATDGLELPDAIHLASVPPGVRFISFDRKFAKRAQRAGRSDIDEAK
jgi:hypothetical protein